MNQASPTRSSNPFDLAGRVVLVFGAGSGLGEASAVRASQRGAVVHCIDLEGEAAERTATAIRAEGGSASAHELDLCQRDDVSALLDQVLASAGSVDGVVCTPGINVRKPLLDISDEEFARVVDLNLKGTFVVLRESGRRLADQGWGSVVLFSSIRSLVIEPGQGVYAATKAGIVQMARAAAAELGRHGVRVNAVAPGVIETPLTEPIQRNHAWARAYAQKSVLDRWGSAEEVADPVCFLLSEAASYVTGTVLFVDGGWTAADGRFDPPGFGGSRDHGDANGEDA